MRRMFFLPCITNSTQVYFCLEKYYPKVLVFYTPNRPSMLQTTLRSGAWPESVISQERCFFPAAICEHNLPLLLSSYFQEELSVDQISAGMEDITVFQLEFYFALDLPLLTSTRSSLELD